MRQRLKTVLRGLPLCLLAVVLWREKPWTVELTARAPWALIMSILLNFVVLVPLKAARWRVALNDPPPFRQVLAATLEGFLANAAIGFGSGDVVRAARLGPRVDAARLRRAESVAGGIGDPSRVPEFGSQIAVDYAATLAERGAEVFALAIL